MTSGTDTPLLEAAGIEKTFGTAGRATVRAVAGADLLLNSGDFVLVIGPSGSGKTTLLSIVGCLLRPNSGTLTLSGSDVLALSQSELTRFRRQQIGYVFQEFRLLDSLSVIENVELPLNLAGVTRPRSRMRARSVLGELGLLHLQDDLPAGLSGGEKQRVAVARALVNDPPLLLADEPTGSLDSRSGEAIIGLLHRSATGRGQAVLVVSHDRRIERFAKRVLKMEDGRLCA